MFMYMQYGPYICIGVILAILFVLWAFWGGKSYDFVGLAPLSPETCGSYTGSLYNWGNITPATEANITLEANQENQSSVVIDNTPAIPDEFRSEYISQTDEVNLDEVNLDANPDQSEESIENIVCPQDSGQGLPVILDHVVFSQDSVQGLPLILDHVPASYKSRLQSATVKNLPQPLNPVTFQQNRGRFISRGERMCCQTMTSIYGVPFTTVRPNWLENPETGENLELDCYNDELRIAVEYNGEQHYKWPNFTNQTYQQFINQVRRDEYKMDACDRNGVYLIVVPFNIPYEKIPGYIMSHLPETIRKRLQEERTLINITN